MVTRRTIITSGVLAILVLWAIWGIPIYSSTLYFDESTGSEKTIRQLWTGRIVSTSYRESALEAFMRANHPEELKQRWCFLGKSEFNIFGDGLSAASGLTPASYTFSSGFFDDYCRRNSDEENLMLYRKISAGDEEEIEALVGEILGE
jgi:hypothetical protein